jgi:AcrR family transcriptional regulator
MPAKEESLRDRQRAQIRADIRRAAYALFLERGYDAVTTEEIALAAGVSPRTLFRHIPTKEDLVLGPVRHAGSAIAELLQHRDASEAPDVALANALTARIRTFEDRESLEWRQVIRADPDLLGRVTVVAPADRERIIKLVAERMGVDPDLDVRPGLLVQLTFAAADFAFLRWLRQDKNPTALQLLVAEAVGAVNSPRWTSESPSTG